MSGDVALQRVNIYLTEFRSNTSENSRYEALDAARSALVDARRAHVATSDLLPVFVDLCNHAVADRSPSIRTILLQIIEDHVLRELPTMAPPATSFLPRALHDENHIVAARAVRTLAMVFRKFLGYVVSVGVGNQPGKFPEAKLAVWLQMQQKAISFIHTQDERLRKAAIKFAETVVLALSISEGPGSADHFTLSYLARKNPKSHHLDVRHMEAEGIRCVKSIGQFVLTSLKGHVITVNGSGTGNIRGLPPLSFMTAISVLGNLVRRRRKLIEFTLTPILRAVRGVVTYNAPQNPIQHLTEGQRLSIVHVLRFNLLGFRHFSHTRSGAVSNDITQATSDLAAFEKHEDVKRKERAAMHAAREQVQNRMVAEAAEAEKRRRAAAHVHPSTSLKRPRPNEQPSMWPRLPPKEAWAVTASIVRSMPPQEVVNFVMTRLLLNIPPAETVPAANRAQQRHPGSRTSGSNEPSAKRAKKSRFASKDLKPVPEAPNQVQKTKVSVRRKVAPPVVPVRLSSAAVERLVSLCCERVLRMEKRAISSGAGPLRVQLLARLLTMQAQKNSSESGRFIEESCAFMVSDINGNSNLVQAWLFSLTCSEEISALPARPVVNGAITLPNSKTAGKSKNEKVELDKKINGKGENGTSNDMDGKQSANSDMKGQQAINPPDKTLSEVKVEDPMEATELEGNQPNSVTAQPTSSGDDVSENKGNETTNKIVEPPAANITEDRMDVEETLEQEELAPLVRNLAYTKILGRLLQLVLEKYPNDNDAYSKLLVDAPFIPESAMKTIEELCKDPSKMKLGLGTLRDIVMYRPGDDRWSALSLLFTFTTHEDEVLRGPAVRLVANKIFVESAGVLAEQIQKKALNTLQSAINNLSDPVKDEEVTRIERGSQLVAALCGQKQELLSDFAAVYKCAPARAQRVLLARAKDLAVQLGMGSTPIIALVSGNLLSSPVTDKLDTPKSDGLELLALDMLKAVLKKFGKPSEQMVQAAQQRYESSRDIRFIIAVLAGLKKKALLKYLPALVEATHGDSTDNSKEMSERLKTRFSEVISTIMSARKPELSPAELLTELHNIESTPAVSEAVRACFEMKSIYKQESVAQALQQLVMKTVIPDLFMRTVYMARVFYPELEKYLTDSVMMPLIDKQVWKNKQAWEGYLLYCREIKERSLRILLRLPVVQLADAIDKQKAIRTVFRELLGNPRNLKKSRLSAKHRKAIQGALNKHKGEK